MSDIEKEIRLKVNSEQISRIKHNTEVITQKERILDITCGKYGFESLSKLGYICRIRLKNNKCKLEIKKYINDEKAIEKSLDLKSPKEGIEFLELLEMIPYLILDRYRESRKYNDLIIYIDEFQNTIGNYIEIEYQKSSRDEALKFINKMNIKLDLKEKYGDIIRTRITEDKDFERQFYKTLDSYKKKL